MELTYHFFHKKVVDHLPNVIHIGPILAAKLQMLGIISESNMLRS